MQFALRNDIPVTLHAAASAVLYLASLHLAASFEPGLLVENHMLHRWLHERLSEGDRAVHAGHIAPPPRPGLGLDLAPADLD